MKKITFLLSLLLASAGVTASAQDSYTWKKLSADADLTKAVTSLDALQNGGTYAFYSVGKSKYVKIDKYDYNNLHFGNIASLTASDEDAGLAVFTFHITNSGETTTYTFETGVSGMYMGAPQDGATKASATAANFVIQTTDSQNKSSESGNFCIKSTTGNANSAWFDMQNDQFVGWQGKDANCWYKIVPVTVSNEVVTCYETTYTLKEGENILDTGHQWLKSGTTFTYAIDKKSYFYSDMVSASSDMVVKEGNTEFNYTTNLVETMPFEFGKNYPLNTRGDESYYITAEDGSSKVCGSVTFTAESANNYGAYANRIWSFERSRLGVKIRNLATGKYMKTNGNAAVTLVDAANATELYVDKGNSTGMFTLTNGSTNTYLGSHLDENADGFNERLRLWTADGAKTDGGSNFTIADVSAESDFMTLGKSALSNTLNVASADASKYLTYEVGTAYDAAKGKVSTATTIEDLQAIYNEAVTATPATALIPDANAYYRVKSVVAADGNAYLSTDEMFVGKDGALNTAYNGNQAYDGKTLNRTITRATASAAFGPQIWQFVKTNDGYQLKNANTNCNSAFFDGGNLDMPVNVGYGQSITLKPAFASTNGDNSYVSIVWNGKYVGAQNGKYYGVTGYSANNETNIWQIEKVTTVPVSITDAKYATVAFPFATKVATPSVKAYYATGAADGMITLVEYPEGIIPANQGALLYNEAGATTANLTVEATDKTVEGNILMPATAKRAGFDANATYVLAKNAAGEAAFLKNGLTVVPANKAYVATENIPAGNGSNVLNFNFGQVTGINGVVAADKAGVQYFDLQGRRVLYPAHGIFVTNTGKKVFVK